MFKNKLLIMVFALLFATTFMFSACSLTPEPIEKDGVMLSNVRFETSNVKSGDKNNEYKSLRATFVLENTTEDRLKVEISLSFLADVWSEVRVIEVKEFVLEPLAKESKSISKDKIYSLIREKKIYLKSVTKI